MEKIINALVLAITKKKKPALTLLSIIAVWVIGYILGSYIEVANGLGINFSLAVMGFFIIDAIESKK